MESFVTVLSKKLLKKYYWDWRNGRPNIATMPEDLKKTILERLHENVSEYEGVTPYYTLANLLGIYNRVLTQDEDGVVFCVAPPGFGKTTVSLICAAFLDKTIKEDPGRIIFDIEELKLFLRLAAVELKKEKNCKLNGVFYKSKLKGKAVVLDEGVFMMFSGDATTKDGKMIQKLFSVIRALNLIFFVNVTNFRKVNRGVKEDRIISLFRVIKRGTINYYSKKKLKKVKIQSEDIYWARPNYTELFGKIKKDSNFWVMYEDKKAQFLYKSVEEETAKDPKKPGRQPTKKLKILENE